MEDSMKPAAHIMVGIPASGKSTLAKSFGLPVYSTDAHIEAYTKSVGKTYNEYFQDSIGEATKEFNAQINAAIDAGQSFVWDQTNLGVKKRQSIIRRLNKTHLIIAHVVNMPTGDEQITEYNKRLDARASKKHIPSYIIANMVNNFHAVTLEEGFDEIRIYDIYGNISMTLMNNPLGLCGKGIQNKYLRD